MTLLIKPRGENGLIHDVTPQSAGWGYVGFAAHRLSTGMKAAGGEAGRETILVLVEGKARITIDGVAFGILGERMTVFDDGLPHAIYAPPGAKWTAEATTLCTIGVCTAPAMGGKPAAVIGPAGIQRVTRGKGANTRYIHPIAMEDRDVAESLLVTEVFTPAGNWSSYPPHRHDEDRFPEMTYLEETYYHRLSPPTGFGIQRVYTEDDSLDETMAVADHDVVLVPKGHHPCAAPHGVEMYYLNVMAGPLRKWRFGLHPDYAWLVERDAKT